MSDKKRVSRRKRWNLADAKAQLSHLVKRAAAGEEIDTALRGVPRARLVPLDSAEKRALRVPGKGKGRFQMGLDFDNPLRKSSPHLRTAGMDRGAFLYPVVDNS